jgi:hypothetical protein
MTTQTHDQFTFLYEDENRKVLHEFKALMAQDVIQHFIDFIKGCGYVESSIYETMQEMTEMYFESEETIDLPLQQDTLKAA